ncbi:MAG TPA: RNA-binding S4 domain-containing protein [bacterium]|nr:RNA-binding S4 domain-containing protein [bacterium]
MRLDVFLKASSIAKRRAFAKELCDQGCVKVNGNVAKAGRAVQVGDHIEISKRGHLKTLKVLELPAKSFNKTRANECYEVLEESNDNLASQGHP